MELPLSSRQRRPHAKSSGGCGTCKARRVKCDETKPTCERCRRAQRTCTGYIANVTRLPIQRKPYHKGFRFVNTLSDPDAEAGSDATSDQVPSPKSSLSADTDSTLVDFFLTATMPRMQSCFDDGFLREFDHQLITDNEVLRHASITLCLQHMLFAKLREVGSVATESGDLRLRCTQAYTRSLSSFQCALGGSKYNPIVTAKASVLLSTVESMRGNSGGAQAHLMGAIGIIQQAYSKETRDENKPSMTLARSCIAKGLSLSLHSVDLTLFGTVRGFAASQADQFPNQENELLGISLLIDSVGIKIFEFMAALDFAGVDARALAATQQRFISHLAAIRRALDNLYPSLQSSEIPTMHISRARIALCTIYARTAASRKQVAYDLYQDDFVAVLDMIQEAVDELPASSTGNGHSAVVCPEIGFITTLFSVSKLCRHPTIRRRALNLLQFAPAQEGIWNAADTRQLGQALMDFEELETDGSRRLYVGEENRIHHASLRKLQSDSDEVIRKWIDIVYKPRPGMQGWERGYIELPRPGADTTDSAGSWATQIPHMADRLNLNELEANYKNFNANTPTSSDSWS